nr:hypothetical protein [Escherichia coli]
MGSCAAPSAKGDDSLSPPTICNSAGSSMLATIRTVPPQWTQAVTSMEKDPLEALRPAHRTALLLGRGASFALASAGSHSGVMPPAAP